MRYLEIKVIDHLDLERAPSNQLSKFWVHLTENGLAQPIYIPVMVAKGSEEGPVLGITAVVHGNELNGLSVIQKIFSKLDISNLKGTLVGVPVVNIPGINNQSRYFNDGDDLNRVMPGKADGTPSQVYAHRLLSRVIYQFDYLIDLHTASFGRVNSYYIRANMRRKVPAKMVYLLNSQIILNTEGADGTLRGAASDLGIHSITVEAGDPNTFQKEMINSSYTGIFNVMAYLKMLDIEVKMPIQEPVYCHSSHWLYADTGGILVVFPQVAQQVCIGERIAVVKDIFGEVIKEYFSPANGIVIGKNVHPICQTGARMLHLGFLP